MCMKAVSDSPIGLQSSQAQLPCYSSENSSTPSTVAAPATVPKSTNPIHNKSFLLLIVQLKNNM